MPTNEDIQKIVHRELLNETSKLITRFWWTVSAMTVAVLGAWFGLYYQVQSQGIIIERNYLDTQRSIETLRTDYRNDIKDMKDDIRFIREQLTR